MLAEQNKKMVIGTILNIELQGKVGESDWKIFTELNEEVLITLDIPEELRKKDVIYYIVRNHDGEYTLLEDLDEEINTITFKTDRFSTYAIVYEKQKCDLCGICTGLFGVCIFVYIAAVIVIAGVIALVIVYRKKKVARA